MSKVKRKLSGHTLRPTARAVGFCVFGGRSCAHHAGRYVHTYMLYNIKNKCRYVCIYRKIVVNLQVERGTETTYKTQRYERNI